MNSSSDASAAKAAASAGRRGGPLTSGTRENAERTDGPHQGASGVSPPPTFTVRPARTTDVARIVEMAQPLVENRVLVPKERVVYYEAIQEFLVAEDHQSSLAGFGALHVMWEDLAEVRTLATLDSWRGHGVGSALLNQLLERARSLGVARVFCLTFEVEFFTRHGFRIMADQAPVDPEVYAELLRSPDEGVAEFLDLARVKPNTLGNTRMILDLGSPQH